METTKVNIDRKPITSEEINQYKDFNAILSKFPGYHVPFYKTGWFITTLATVAVAVGTLIYFNTQEQNPAQHTIAELDSPPPVEQDFTYTEDSRCFRPPLKNQDIPYVKVKINPAVSQVINTPGGMQLKIAENSFIKEDGSPLLCPEIELAYREFLNPMEYWTAGIPMRYDVNGKANQFESAGMLEIWGYCDNEPIKLHPEKPIQLSIPQTAHRADMNYYTLDTTNGKWTERNDLIVGRINTETEKTEPKNVLQTTLTKEEAVASVQPLHKEKRELEKDIAQLKKTQPLEPKQKKSSLPAFNIDILTDQFPELEAYSNTTFQITEEKYYKPEIFKRIWADMRLEKAPNGDYLVRLTDGNDKEVIPVKPVFDEKNYAEAKTRFDKLFNQYSEKLEQKEKRLAEVEKEIAALQQVIKGQNDQAVFERMEKVEKRKQAITKITNAIVANVPSFGVVNIDKPQAPPSAQRVSGSIVNGNKIKIGVTMLFLYDKIRNTIFPVLRSENPTDKITFFKDAGNNYQLLVIDGENNLYHVDAIAFAAGTKQTENATLQAKEINLGQLSQVERNAILQAKVN